MTHQPRPGPRPEALTTTLGALLPHTARTAQAAADSLRGWTLRRLAGSPEDPIDLPEQSLAELLLLLGRGPGPHNRRDSLGYASARDQNISRLLIPSQGQLALHQAVLSLMTAEASCAAALGAAALGAADPGAADPGAADPGAAELDTDASLAADWKHWSARGEDFGLPQLLLALSSQPLLSAHGPSSAQQRLLELHPGTQAVPYGPAMGELDSPTIWSAKDAPKQNMYNVWITPRGAQHLTSSPEYQALSRRDQERFWSNAHEESTAATLREAQRLGFPTKQVRDPTRRSKTTAWIGTRHGWRQIGWSRTEIEPAEGLSDHLLEPNTDSRSLTASFMRGDGPRRPGGDDHQLLLDNILALQLTVWRLAGWPTGALSGRMAAAWRISQAWVSPQTIHWLRTL